ncbi:MAG: hypothetical protein F9K18_09390 [Thermoanaerobaculia bacterium]|nr:MAG: hypothetical protein F9K18_09390 [Thermoanaerobaculia bacterium]
MAILGLAGFLGPASSDPHRGTGRATRRAEIVGLAVTDSSGVAISPDGSEVVGYDVTPSRPALLRRSLDSFEIRRMPGSENGFNPFFAPDGRSIGFFSGEQICVLELAGATRRCLARAQGFATGSWGRDDAIVFSSQTSGEPVSGLWRVPSAGGEAVRLTTVDASRGERAHTYPQRLPDGRNVLLTVLGETQNGVAVVPLAGGTPRTLLANASRGRVVPSGHLIFWDELRGRLTAVAFDPDRLAVTGVPFELGIELNTSSDAVVSFDVSDDGTLVYSLGGMFGGDFTIEIVDRAGQPTPLIAELASWGQPRVSPDGERLLLRRAAQPDCSLWLFDLRRHSLARLGVDGDNHNPLWLAAGESLLSSRQDFGRLDRQVYRVALDGGGPPEGIVVNAGFSAQAESVSPDGRFLALTHDNRRDRNDIYIHDRQSGETRPFLVTEFDEDFPAFSPDGTLLAYAANDSGRNEVYVRPFPGPGGKYLISNQGGTGPVWSRDGRELFYAEGQRLMRVAIERSPRFAASSPQRLFESPDYVWERPRNYDVLPGGSGFVMVRRGAATPATRSLRVVFDWFAELERLAPKGAR